MKEHAGKRGGEVETRGKEWGQKWEIIIVWPGEIKPLAWGLILRQI